MPRVYEPYEDKHKTPKGFGSLCPRAMPLSVAEALLHRAVAVDGCGQNKLWAASGRWCFCAHPSTGGGADVWHGFPVVGGEVDERVLARREDARMISHQEHGRLRKQRALPEAWP
jgi:hypothetical protein